MAVRPGPNASIYVNESGFPEAVAAAARQCQKTPDTVSLPCFPRELQQKFSAVEDQLRQSLTKLSRQQRRSLDEFINNTFYSDHPGGKQPKIPNSPRDLFQHLQKYWKNKVSINALMQLADHLGDAAPEFKRMAEEYEQALREFLRSGDVNWGQHAPLRQPAGYTTLVVKMNISPRETTAKALDALKFWAEKLIPFGSKSCISILLAGLTTDGDTCSLVFFVSEQYIIRLFEWAQHNKGVIHTFGMETFAVPEQVTLDTQSGETVHTLDMPEELCILLIGETGSGKTTLMNNVMGKVMATPGHELTSDTSDIKRYHATVRGVHICLYDTPGTRNAVKGADKKLKRRIKDIIKHNKIDLVIFCVSLQSTRLTENHLATLQLYHEAGIRWENTVIALTFADRVQASCSERRDAFDEAEYFTKKIRKWQEEITRVLKKMGVSENVADNVSVHATADDRTVKLQNGEEWLKPLYVNILKALPPTASFRFFDTTSEAICNEHAEPVPLSPGLIQVLKEQMYEVLLGFQTAGAMSALAIGLGATAIGASILALSSAAVVVGAVTCGAGCFVVIGAGIALMVVGGLAVYWCVHCNKDYRKIEDSQSVVDNKK